MKIFIGVLYVTDVVNCCFNMAWIYDILVNHFGECTGVLHMPCAESAVDDPSALAAGNWGEPWAIILAPHGCLTVLCV